MGLSRERRKGGLLMHASIPTTYVSLVFLCVPFIFSILSTYYSFLSPFLLFTTIPFYTICHCEIYHFYPLTTFGSLWPSFQDYPLACRPPSHYLCSECVGCTTLHSQTKLLVLFLTSLRFHFTHSDKD